LSNHYETLVFDCDGVILNSNHIKTSAFYEVTKIYGKEKALELVKYHTNNGGVSRYAKFEYFVNEILNIPNPLDLKSKLIHQYSLVLHKQLALCEVANGIADLSKATSNSRWMVVSGGDENELRYIFRKLGIFDFFNYGIYGSPKTKEQILREQIDSGRLLFPALFIGDSRYDHVAAVSTGLDFLFVSDWSEFAEWKEYCEEHHIPVLANISQIKNFLQL